MCSRSCVSSRTAIADISVFLNSQDQQLLWMEVYFVCFYFSVSLSSIVVATNFNKKNITGCSIVVWPSSYMNMYMWFIFVCSSVKCISWLIQIVKSKSWTFCRCQNLRWAVSIKRTWNVICGYVCVREGEKESVCVFV